MKSVIFTFSSDSRQSNQRSVVSVTTRRDGAYLPGSVSETDPPLMLRRGCLFLLLSHREAFIQVSLVSCVQGGGGGGCGPCVGLEPVILKPQSVLHQASSLKPQFFPSALRHSQPSRGKGACEEGEVRRCAELDFRFQNKRVATRM